MKALTVCQGWAEAIFSSGKDTENRTWATSHRGEILIHAGKSPKFLEESKLFHANLGLEFPDNLEFGAIIGVVTIQDCVRDYQSPWAMKDCWHWVLENAVRFDESIPCSGKMSLWDYPLISPNALAS